MAESRTALAAALAELRDLTQGVYPAILTERGLPGALDELCSRSAITADLRLFLEGRLPAPVETAAYYVVSEALTNAAKRSHASEVGVAATCHDGLLAVEIADNGVGGAACGTGSGLRACRPGGGAQRPADRVQPPEEGNNVARGVPVRVVVADDAVIVREGLARLLSR